MCGLAQKSWYKVIPIFAYKLVPRSEAFLCQSYQEVFAE
jgi:hypothetical protein